MKQEKNIKTPDLLFGELFVDVQLSRIFPDNKTFVDCVPKRSPGQINSDYQKLKTNPGDGFDLLSFVTDNFKIPEEPSRDYISNEKDIEKHISNLWNVLKREKDVPSAGSSLLPLPYPYVVPGGRFREIYYWDSFFTMIGLKESGRHDLIENMVNNFASLIHTYGHIPNGNRTYYITRSQPPFFSQMVELLAAIRGPEIYEMFLAALEKEYAYWMEGSAKTANGKSFKRVVKLQDGVILNRYWDESSLPRQESYKEDVETAQEAVDERLRKKNVSPGSMNKISTDDIRKKIYQSLRAGAASGWDFSSRWFEDGEKIWTIQTTDIIPVDLNCLVYHQEKILSRAYTKSGQHKKASKLEETAERRKRKINDLFWMDREGWYYDFNMRTGSFSIQKTIAGMTPFFLNVGDSKKIKQAVKVVKKDFLQAGGVVTTLNNTGQQWDAPNGWAPLQWMTIIGLENYGETALAKKIAERWVRLNCKVFQKTGKLMEKYNVMDTNLDAGGGEYPSQDGFGWTNGVLLGLIKKYGIKQ